VIANLRRQLAEAQAEIDMLKKANREWQEHVRTAQARIAALEWVARDAAEELRLLRMRDTAVVYDPTLHVTEQEIANLWSEAIKTGFVENRPEVQVFAERLLAPYAEQISRLTRERDEAHAEPHPRWMGPAEYTARKEAGELPPEGMYYTGECRCTKEGERMGALRAAPKEVVGE
jgi:hypothetical protein